MDNTDRKVPGARGYDVFVSHATRLDPDMQELVDGLVGGLRARRLDVFLDRLHFEGREPLLASLEQAVGQSRIGLLVLTEAAASSTWVAFELAEMARKRAQGTMRILALKLRATAQLPGGLAADVVISPTSLTDLHALTNQVEDAIRTALAQL